MTPERVIEVAIGLYDGPRTGHNAPPTMASAVLAALVEQGYAIIPAEDLQIVSSPRSPVLPDEIMAHLDARARLRAVLSGTAPQPSETPQDTQTGDGGISGPSDLSGTSTALSDARAEEAEEDLDSAQQALARVVQHAHNLASYRPVEADALAAVILNLDPRDCRPGAALAALTEEKPND
ncbi:hypothetical protein AB0J63_26700 [Streptosporangium canum]|uniref:hypothetical protein n=1 Tax=Streptosporangium canum TaxID=324952 RepID=UPI003436F27B